MTKNLEKTGYSIRTELFLYLLRVLQTIFCVFSEIFPMKLLEFFSFYLNKNLVYYLCRGLTTGQTRLYFIISV